MNTFILIKLSYFQARSGAWLKGLWILTGFTCLLFSLNSLANDSQQKTMTIRSLRVEYNEAVENYNRLWNKHNESIDWDIIVVERKQILDRTTYLLGWIIQNIGVNSDAFIQAHEQQKQAWEEWAEAISLREGTALDQARENMLKCLEELNLALLEK